MEVPVEARETFLRVAPINIAVWALGGFFLSLMPSLIGELAPGRTQVLGGVSVAALTFSGAAAVLLLRNLSARTALLASSPAMIVGPALILFSLDVSSTSVLMMGAVVSGFGFGAGFLGAMRSLAALATPRQRAGLLSAFYTESYLANAVPALIAGFAAQRLGLPETAAIFVAIILALAALSFALTLLAKPSVERKP